MSSVHIVFVEEIDVVASQDNHTLLLDIVSRKLYDGALEHNRLILVSELSHHLRCYYITCFDHLLFTLRIFITSTCT